MTQSAPTSKSILNAIKGIPSARSPIWFLRQAGRYLPEYQKIRQSFDFVDLYKNPQKSSDVTLMPINRFDLDAAIIFSDILILPEALGQNLSFGKGHGPILKPCVSFETNLANFEKISVTESLDFIAQALDCVRSKLPKHVSLIGFAGAPFTLASYMIEGSTSRNFLKTKSLAFHKPKFFADFLRVLAHKIKDLLVLQEKAGAEVLMLFDSWVGNVTPEDYNTYVYPAMKLLVQEFKKECSVPLIYYPGQNPHLLGCIENLDFDVIALDWRFDLQSAIKALHRTNPNMSVQGNLDPQVLFGPEDLIRQKVKNILKILQKKAPHRHIFNVGHGILPKTPIDSIHWTIDEVRNFQGISI